MYNCTSIWSILPVANRAISAAQIHRRFFILLLHSWVFYWEIADKKTKNKFPDERWRWFQMRFLTLLSCLCVERRIIRSWIQTIMSEYCLNADNRLMLTLISIHLPIYYLICWYITSQPTEICLKRMKPIEKGTHTKERKKDHWSLTVFEPLQTGKYLKPVSSFSYNAFGFIKNNAQCTPFILMI